MHNMYLCEKVMHVLHATLSALTTLAFQKLWIEFQRRRFEFPIGKNYLLVWKGRVFPPNEISIFRTSIGF